VRAKSFILKPTNGYGYRLVVDLRAKDKEVRQQVAKVVKSGSGKSGKNGRGRDLIIAIDAGHGGEDPGAKGPNGVYEKNVVFAIARRLARLVDKEPGMWAVMIRKGDYYIGLRKRIHKARAAKADLFISIHADAFRDRRVRGSSVYTLSQRGASSEAAQWLAKRENRADLVGGVELADKNDLLASVLLDLSMSATMVASREAADDVLKQLRGLGKTHKRQVQQAGFRVLKAPDIPSMLVEIAFISNPVEEKRLKNPNHQERVAKALLTGIRNYFRTYPPAGTWMAQHTPRQHVITRGDTLSTIAQQYRIRVNDLRNVNKLSGDRIRVGQVLSIPES
jgi:N-acetylmuramoyl-L-alanine amidase